MQRRREGERERRPNWCEQRVYVTRMENNEAKGKGDSRNERESDIDGYSLHLTASLTVDIPFHLARNGMYHITISNQMSTSAVNGAWANTSWNGEDIVRLQMRERSARQKG